LSSGELLGLDGDTGRFRPLHPPHGLGHRHILECLVCPVDQAINTGRHLVGLDLLRRRAALLVFHHQARLGSDFSQSVGGHVRQGVLLNHPATVCRRVDDVHVRADRFVQRLLGADGVIHHAAGLAPPEVSEVRHDGVVVIRAVGIV